MKNVKSSIIVFNIMTQLSAMLLLVSLAYGWNYIAASTLVYLIYKLGSVR